MLYLDLFKIIYADFKKRKFSTFLTFFSISLGILAVFVIILVSIGFESSLVKQFEDLGSNRIYISPTGSNFGMSNSKKNFSDFEINLIKNQPYVKEVYPYYFTFFQIKYGNEYKNKQALGLYLDQNYFENMNLKIGEGRFANLNEKYSIVIGSNAATDLFSKDLVIGSNIYVKDTKFKVVGILESIGNPQDDSNIYFPLDTVREISDAGTSVSIADVIVEPSYDVKLAGENIKVILERRLGKDTIDIMTPDQILEQLGTILDIIRYTLGGIAFVALIVGALGIINTMFVIVTEKIPEIGIMKSIGATNFQILSLFTFQAGLLGLVGAILGIFFGSLIAILFESIAKSAGYSFLTITIDSIVVLYLLVFGFFVGIFSGFVPAYRASKINIVEAIRKWYQF